MPQRFTAESIQSVDFGSGVEPGSRRDRALRASRIEIKIDRITKKNGDIFQKKLDFLFLVFLGPAFFLWVKGMTDQQLALQAINEAQLILEDYLRPRPQNNERILDRLVEVSNAPDLVVAVSRLQRQSSLAMRK
jgi:hypothetical protein